MENLSTIENLSNAAIIIVKQAPKNMHPRRVRCRLYYFPSERALVSNYPTAYLAIPDC
jgi:hypothetical protein